LENKNHEQQQKSQKFNVANLPEMLNYPLNASNQSNAKTQ
jgi:hypothetical protein